MIKIREITPKDYKEIVSLWERGGMKYDPEGRDSEKMITFQIEINPGLSLAAFDGKRMVGVLLGTYDGRRGWLNRLCVDPGYRRKGIATMLITECEKRMLRRGAKVIAALVEDCNTPSLALCESLGYVPRRDIIYMRKKID